MNAAITLVRAQYFALGVVAGCALWVGIGLVVFTDWGTLLLASAVVDESAVQEEAQEMLHTAVAKVRSNSIAGATPKVLAGDDTMPGCNYSLADLEGSHYILANAVIPRDNGYVEIVAVPLTSSYPLLSIRFRPHTSDDGIVKEHE